MDKNESIQNIVKCITLICRKKEIFEIQKKQKDLNECIIKLSKIESMSEEDCKNFLNIFKKIYDNNFRHFYSEILITLLKINTEDEHKNEDSGTLDLVAENLRIFYEYIEKEYFIDINYTEKFLKKIRKLNDHVAMDLARINRSIKQQKDFEKANLEILEKITNIYKKSTDEETKLIDLQKKTDDYQEFFKKANRDLFNARRESQNIKKDLVSIMGLFLGIFTFFQFNLSQFKDLLEYDPFKRVIYILVINSVFCIGIFLIFAIIDFLIYRTPRMLRLFIVKKENSWTLTGLFWGSTFLYILFLIFLLFFLSKDGGRETLIQLKNEAENIKEEHLKFYEENNKKLKELEIEIKNLKNQNFILIEKIKNQDLKLNIKNNKK